MFLHQKAMPFLLCLLIAASCSRQQTQKQPPPLSRAITPARLEPQSSDSKGVIYPYSIIPGGVRSTKTLKEVMEADPVVGGHHGKVNLGKLQLTVLNSDRKAFVSYRVANQVFWTAKPVQLRKGEEVLTDGEIAIRARCGNQISDQPQQPIQEPSAAPTPAELDTPAELGGTRALASSEVPSALSNLPLGGQLPSGYSANEPGQLIASALPPASSEGQWWGSNSTGGGVAPAIPQSNSAAGERRLSTNPPADPPDRPSPPPLFIYPPPLPPPPGWSPPPDWTPPPGWTPPPTVNPPPVRTPPPGLPPPGGTPPPFTPPYPPGNPPPTDWPPPGSPPPPGAPPPNVPPTEGVPETTTYILTGLGLLAIAVVRTRAQE